MRGKDLLLLTERDIKRGQMNNFIFQPRNHKNDIRKRLQFSEWLLYVDLNK